MAQIMMLVTLKKIDQAFYRCYIHNVSLREKVFLGHTLQCKSRNAILMTVFELKVDLTCEMIYLFFY